MNPMRNRTLPIWAAVPLLLWACTNDYDAFTFTDDAGAASGGTDAGSGGSSGSAGVAGTINLGGSAGTCGNRWVGWNRWVRRLLRNPEALRREMCRYRRPPGRLRLAQL